MFEGISIEYQPDVFADETLHPRLVGWSWQTVLRFLVLQSSVMNLLQQVEKVVFVRQLLFTRALHQRRLPLVPAEKLRFSPCVASTGQQIVSHRLVLGLGGIQQHLLYHFLVQ